MIEDNTTKKRHVILTGGYGSGKTIFGAHIKRMLLAKKRLIYRNKDEGKFKIVIVDYSACNGKISPLSEMIKGYFTAEIETNDVELDLSLQCKLSRHIEEGKNRGLSKFLEELNFSQKPDKVLVFIDEISVNFDLSSIDFKNLTEINVIGCINPMHPKHGDYLLMKGGHHEAVLHGHLKHTYRNSLAIQNIFNGFIWVDHMRNEERKWNLFFSMKNDPGFEEQLKHKKNHNVSLILVRIANSDRGDDHKIAILNKLFKGILCNINIDKKQLSWDFLKETSQVNKLPDKKIVFILCTMSEIPPCMLCEGLGKTCGLEVIYTFFETSYCGLEKNTVIVHHESEILNCYAEISRATHHLILLYKQGSEDKRNQIDILISGSEEVQRYAECKFHRQAAFLDMQATSAYDESNSFEDLTTIFNIKKIYFTENCLRNVGMKYTKRQSFY